MAINKHFSLLLLLFAFLHIMLTEARPIKEMNKTETDPVPAKMSRTTTRKTSFDPEHSVEEYKDDFKPTSPGFSPGVGHKFGKSEVARSGNAGTNSGVRHSGTEVYKDDFRPTGPGHSPGVGHAFETKLKPEAEPRN